MEYTVPISIILLAAVIHASFQLSISTLTVMSGHAIGKQRSQRRLLGLVTGFVIGALVMTSLLLASGLYVAGKLLQEEVFSPIVWAAMCGILFGLGVAVWLFYFRHTKGTALWVPRSMAEYLHERCKKTKSSAEAFGLGMVSVFAELLFLCGPLLVAILTLATLPTMLQIIVGGGYALVSVSTLAVVGWMVQTGYPLSRLQKWREENKRFIQFICGTALIILGWYLYINEVIVLGGIPR